MIAVRFVSPINTAAFICTNVSGHFCSVVIKVYTVKPRYSDPPIRWSPRYNDLEFEPLDFEITQNDSR